MRGREPGFLNRPTVAARSRRKEQASTRKLRQRTQGSCLSCFTLLEQQNPSEPTALTHHGTSPNSGMYLLGKFSRGTPKIFVPLMRSLSFLPSMLFTVIPWRTWRWKRITLLSVTFMLMNSVRRKSNSNPSLNEWTTEDSFITLIHITWASCEKEVLCSGSTGRVVNLNFDSSGLTIMSLFLLNNWKKFALPNVKIDFRVRCAEVKVVQNSLPLRSFTASCVNHLCSTI